MILYTYMSQYIYMHFHVLKQICPYISFVARVCPQASMPDLVYGSVYIYIYIFVYTYFFVYTSYLSIRCRVSEAGLAGCIYIGFRFGIEGASAYPKGHRSPYLWFLVPKP